ncbi:hypothetical protein O6H91_17G058100 [Diphasiastrum complanatum]|uniref:Uncharacterized protein n=1 Tax=Diphasiastrum complanatum TaxID=34168 RepID=A0ACC2B738_DIPCM|nr:hypothetical protein O6H91_17G058100 [Diphasiastrum complanatum]
MVVSVLKQSNVWMMEYIRRESLSCSSNKSHGVGRMRIPALSTSMTAAVLYPGYGAYAVRQQLKPSPRHWPKKKPKGISVNVVAPGLLQRGCSLKGKMREVQGRSYSPATPRLTE